MHEADVVVLVVDATVGATDTEDAVVAVLRHAGVPVLLAANKCDDQRAELEAAGLWSLGLGEPHPVSALHGRGSGDFLDALLAVLPEQGRADAVRFGPHRVALLGSPTSASRACSIGWPARSGWWSTMSPVPRWMRWTSWWNSAVRNGCSSTQRGFGAEPGSRRGTSTTPRCAPEMRSSAASRGGADRRQPADHGAGCPTGVDGRRRGRALVIALNKWDLLDDERRYYVDREFDREFDQVPWARRVNLSARTGRHVDRLVPALEEALDSWSRRVSTGGSTPSCASCAMPTRTRSAAADSPASCSEPRPRRDRRPSCSLRRAS